MLDFGDVPLFCEAAVLSPPEPKHTPAFPPNPCGADLAGFDAGRRRFLLHCCQGTAAAALPSAFGRYAFPSILPSDSSVLPRPDHQFHLHPHYRAQTPLDAALVKTGAESDRFISEQYHDRIAGILAEWSSGLTQSPSEVSAIAKVLGPDFCAGSMPGAVSREVRSGPALEIRRHTPGSALPCGREAFLHELRSAMSSFSKILTAEFEITSIESLPGTTAEQLKTRVRYNLVGSARGSYREQRAGSWELEWASGAAGFVLRSWKASEETRSRCKDPAYLEITAAAFQDAPYSARPHDIPEEHAA